MGGTGVQTYNPAQPEQLPTRLEAGTLNGNCIAGLSASLDYIRAVRGAYARDQELTSPMLSPLFGDFRGFPPTLIQAGSNELLLSDILGTEGDIVAESFYAE